MPFTTISLNEGYAAKRHRDKFNEGPSVAIATGSFTGGRLIYFPEDDRHVDLDRLRYADCVHIDTGAAAGVFDGTLAHEVEDFEGERFSVVLFTARNYRIAPAEI